MSEEGGGKSRGDLEAAGDHSSRPPPNYYGTFQGVANYQPEVPPPSHSVMGFPQPVPPPGYSGSAPHYYHQGYQTVPGYAVAEGRPYRQERLPCCGVGIGWFLVNLPDFDARFIIGFLLGAIPWYIGAFLLLCVRLDYREKPGLIACTIATKENMEEPMKEPMLEEPLEEPMLEFKFEGSPINR